VKPHYVDDAVTLYHGDALAVLQSLPNESVDGVIAVQAGGWVWRGVAIWDKGIGRPMKGRFRNHVEYLVWATNGPVAEQDVYLDSVFRHAPPRPETREHMTEKPVGLIRDLLPLVPKGGTVLDPFMGSGTTGAACVMDGRKFIGVELTEHYADVAADRLRLLATGERSSQEQVAMDFGGAA
jgi:site-specific DNA-methyltransferase (adenine-specific)